MTEQQRPALDPLTRWRMLWPALVMAVALLVAIPFLSGSAVVTLAAAWLAGCSWWVGLVMGAPNDTTTERNAR